MATAPSNWSAKTTASTTHLRPTPKPMRAENLPACRQPDQGRLEKFRVSETDPANAAGKPGPRDFRYVARQWVPGGLGRAQCDGRNRRRCLAQDARSIQSKFGLGPVGVHRLHEGL